MEFPDLQETLDENNYLSDLPHCIFEIILIPYVKKLCENKNSKNLEKLGAFLEKMAICSDKKVNELLNVSFLEPIVLADKELLLSLQRYLGKKSLEELNYWLVRYKQ